MAVKTNWSDLQCGVFSRLNAGPRINAGSTGSNLKQTPQAFNGGTAFIWGPAFI